LIGVSSSIKRMIPVIYIGSKSLICNDIFRMKEGLRIGEVLTIF
jgi:hypothetical protein